MNQVYRLLDQPLVKYLVIIISSAVSAWVFWQVGGSVAQVATRSAAIGASITLGGALGGFVSVFLISLWVFTKLVNQNPQHNQQSQHRRINVLLIPRQFCPPGDNYSCKVVIFDVTTGEERELTPKLRREAGYWMIYLDIWSDNERFTVEIADNAQNKKWLSEFHGVSSIRTEMEAQ